MAIEAYADSMKKKHINFTITPCGTFIDKDHPFLHATPDFLCHCDCCGYGCGEVKCPYCIEGLNFESYCQKKSSCLVSDREKFSLKRDHDYFFQVQQQLHITKRNYCDFIVFAISNNCFKFVQERILPDKEHWNSQVVKLSLFWRTCILPEILGRWYTRKMDLKREPSTVPELGHCYCRNISNEPSATCFNPDCPIKHFHLNCLMVSKVSKKWLCPTCRKLPKFARGRKAKSLQEKKMFLEEALTLEHICVCKKKAMSGEKILKCHNDGCNSGNYFHLHCMSYKNYPNNYKSSWLCNACRLDKIYQKKRSSEANVSDDADVIILRCTESEKIDKYSSIAKLTDHDFNVIASSTGWLENTVIQEAQVLLKRIKPDIQGFQRPSLGACLNFDQVTGDFIQILHTGGNHWVCVSSIGCDIGVVKLFDSLFHDVILADLELQLQNLLHDELKGISTVPVQQQENGSDCGVFAIAFATSLVYTMETDIPYFDIPKMRPHLSACLKSGAMTPFPTI